MKSEKQFLIVYWTAFLLATLCAFWPGLNKLGVLFDGAALGVVALYAVNLVFPARQVKAA